EAGHAGARQIWESLGVYLGYSLAHYADFYSDCRHVLILGRCTSGSGGEIILREARAVLESEFPGLAEQLHLYLPDEKTRRVGQAIAAASLPVVNRE
ncbi:MAG TPA: ROK family protein, partial [Anaerolineae bacterium]|nr:ROK family protein [Anaerolineae bacterium]